MCLAQGPQHCDAGLESSALPLSHCAPYMHQVGLESSIPQYEVKHSTNRLILSGIDAMTVKIIKLPAIP